MQKDLKKRRDEERRNRHMQSEQEHHHNVQEFTNAAEMPLKSSLKNSRERYQKPECSGSNEQARHRSTSYPRGKGQYQKDVQEDRRDEMDNCVSARYDEKSQFPSSIHHTLRERSPSADDRHGSKRGDQEERMSRWVANQQDIQYTNSRSRSKHNQKSPRNSKSPLSESHEENHLGAARSGDKKAINSNDFVPTKMTRAEHQDEITDHKMPISAYHARDESFNSTSNRDQKSIRQPRTEQQTQQNTTRRDGNGHVDHIMTNFNREKDQFNAKLKDLKQKLQTLSLSPQR